MDYPLASGSRSSRLSLSRKHKITDSPKTPKQNFIKQPKISETSNIEKINYTPENRIQNNNVIGEDSPNQNYEFYSLSQKLMMDDDRDVVWNFESNQSNNKRIISTPKNKFTREDNKLKSSIKISLLKKGKHSCGEGLSKLQALQNEKFKSNGSTSSTTFDSLRQDTLINLDNVLELESFDSYNLDHKDSLDSYNLAQKDCDITNIEVPQCNSVPKDKEPFFDEDDSFLFQHSQAVEKISIEPGNSKDIKIFKETKNTNYSKNEDFKSKDPQFLDDKDLLTPPAACEDSFDDIFLSIDLTSVNENKKSQFQRHNSMPSKSSIDKFPSTSFIRIGSENNFDKETVIKTNNDNPTSTKRDIFISCSTSNSSTEDFGSIKDPFLNNGNIKRCSKEEVEAKRLEAQRKRLLRMKQNVRK